MSGTAFFNGSLVVQDNSTAFRNDGNNVDIDQEMARLAQNTLAV
jgi:flagellar basal-body rod protein FlgB